MSDLSKYTPEELRERLKAAILSMTEDQLGILDKWWEEEGKYMFEGNTSKNSI